MPMPSLTLLIIAHNAMPHLKEAVASALRQDSTDFTCLILDNASTDSTFSWLEQVANDRGDALPKLEIARLPEHVCLTDALCLGLDLVRTEFTAILEAEDTAAPDRISTLLAFFREHPDIDLVSSDVMYRDGSGNISGAAVFPEEHHALCALLSVQGCPPHSACAFRTAAANLAGGYPAAFPQSPAFALWLNMLRTGSRTANIARPLVTVRRSPTRTGRALSLLMVRAEETYRLMQTLLGLPGLKRGARQAARFRAAAALFRLGRTRRALAEAWRGVAEAPLLAPFNPLWRQRGKIPGLQRPGI